MNSQEFITIFQELIQEETPINLSTPLESLEAWDSMAIMALVAWFDVEQQKKVSFEDLQDLETVGDIARLVPGFSE